MIAVPPLLAGAVYVTVAVLYAVAVAVPIVGAPGTDQVVILPEDELDEAEQPILDRTAERIGYRPVAD